MAASSTERLEYVRPPEMPGLEVVRADHCTHSWRIVHGTYVVCALLDTSGEEIRWTYRGKVHATGAGSLMLMEPGDSQVSLDPVPSCTLRSALLAPWLVERAAVGLGLPAHQSRLCRPFTKDQAIFEAAAQFHASLESDSTVSERIERLGVCLRLLLERCGERRSMQRLRAERRMLLRARDFIHANHSCSIRIDALVEATGFSRYHLVRAFKKEFGLPPHAYQIAVRMERARELLAFGETPAQIAVELGFTDQSHFNRRFSGFMGVTPRQYQDGIRRSN